MKNITKFPEQSFHKFSTPEYVTLMDRFISQTAAMGAEKLHYEEADMARLRELQGQLQNNCAHTTATENTAKITILDGQRTALGQYIINTVKNCITLPMAGKSEAATAMYVMLKPYYGFYNKTTTQKTAILDGMLADLSNEEIAAHITTLGLEDAIENLTLKNAQLKVQVDMRTQTRKQNKIVDSATLRQEMDALYKYITTVAFAHNVVTPSQEADAYIATINAIIGEINTSYNQRMAKTDKNENSDNPENTENSNNSENTENTENSENSENTENSEN